MSRRMYFHPQKVFNEICHVGSDRLLMHDGTQYYKVKVTSPSKLEIWPFSKAIFAIYNGS